MKNKKIYRSMVLALALFMSGCGQNKNEVIENMNRAIEAYKSGDENNLMEATKRAEKEIKKINKEAKKNGPTEETYAARFAYDGVTAIEDIVESDSYLDTVIAALDTGEMKIEAQEYKEGEESEVLTYFIAAGGNINSAEDTLESLNVATLNNKTFNQAKKKTEEALEEIKTVYADLSDDIQIAYGLSDEQMEEIMSVEGIPGWDSTRYIDGIGDLSIALQGTPEEIDRAIEHLQNEIEEGTQAIQQSIDDFGEEFEEGFSKAQQDIKEGAKKRHDEANEKTQSWLDQLKYASEEQRKYDEEHGF